uniref:CS domain-containing protein n=1 Tax=Pyrodinium bahamense TaxID=73915 RepID=A0A7S0F8W5_9DINO|mmetsp:Transcript_12821/g.35488  ORF Transcript_12821/g.35488 Transcript_12821/m.35488 type:complete len:165 (+) Transcript_12821:71-565(+)
MALQPDVLWAQRKDSLYVTIDLKEVQDMKVSLEAEKLSFSGKVEGSLYEFSLEWFAPIKKDESKWSTKRLIEFYLKKAEEQPWPRLRQTKDKAPWVKVDWKRWQDSDDEDEKGGFNVDGMGDMNFGDMGGDDFDSDDEQDLPDLEPTATAASGEAQDEAKESKE